MRSPRRGVGGLMHAADEVEVPNHVPPARTADLVGLAEDLSKVEALPQRQRGDQIGDGRTDGDDHDQSTTDRLGVDDSAAALVDDQRGDTQDRRSVRLGRQDGAAVVGEGPPLVGRRRAKRTAPGRPTPRLRRSGCGRRRPANPTSWRPGPDHLDHHDDDVKPSARRSRTSGRRLSNAGSLPSGAWMLRPCGPSAWPWPSSPWSWSSSVGSLIGVVLVLEGDVQQDANVAVTQRVGRPCGRGGGRAPRRAPAGDAGACDAADWLMPATAARSHTHSSPPCNSP